MAHTNPKGIPEWQRQNPEAAGVRESSDSDQENPSGAQKSPSDDQEISRSDQENSSSDQDNSSGDRDRIDDKSENPDLQPSRALLLEQAAKFLENDEIRDSSTDRKIEFLASKGLTNEEIHNLLGVSRNEDTVSSEEAIQEPPSTLQDSNLPSEPPQLSSPSPPEIPPIITYPEFLLHSQKPPPLITAKRLLTTLYVATGAAATIYGGSQYLVSPMVESLTSARHSLFGATSVSLAILNDKLRSVVSTVPFSALYTKSNAEFEVKDDDSSSIVSDPEELFHRDFGTQTSLLPTPSSRPSTSSSTSAQATVALSTTDHQASRLKAVQSNLSDFLTSYNSLGDSDMRFDRNTLVFRRYLDDLKLGRMYGSSDDGVIKPANNEDEYAKVRAEIRGVKGVFLSARSFPVAGTKSRVGA